MARVLITDGPGTGEVFTIERAAILGRLPSNDVPLKDKKSSREHAKIYRQGKDFAIVDLNSSNGTFVNGQKVTKRVLEEGDEIVIGTVAMRYELEEHEKEAKEEPQRKSLDEAFEAAKEEKPAPGGVGSIQMSGHQPLQFQRIRPGRSLLGFDLSQLPDTVQMFIKIGVLALFVLLLWLVITSLTTG